MAKARKLDNNTTSMQVSWHDKDLLSCYKKKKVSKTGIVIYETDAEVFSRVMNYIKNNVKPENIAPQSTYPVMLNTLQAG